MKAIKKFIGKYGFWGGFYTLVIVLGFLPLAFDLPLPTKSLTFDSFTYREAVPGAVPEKRTLPDSWRHNSSLQTEVGIYTASFTLEQTPTDLWGVFLPAHRSNLSVTINDTYVGDGGPFEPILARNGMHPLLLSIPKGLLREGTNSLVIQLHAAPAGHGFLDPVYLGPYKNLRTSYKIHYLALQTSTQIITFSMLVLGIVMFVIWVNRRKEVTYGLLAGMALSWAVQNLNLTVSEIPTTLVTWERMMHLSAVWVSSFAYFFISTYFIEYKNSLAPEKAGTEQKYSKYAKANLIYSVSLSLLLLLLPMSLFYKVFYIAAMPYQFSLMVYILVQMCRISLLTNMLADRLLTAVSITGVLYISHDALVTTGIIKTHIFYLSEVFGFFSFMFFGWMLLSKFVDATKRLENTNTVLSERIKQREQELHTIFEKQKAYENQEAREKERERLMRDIHDGLGGQLVSILSIVEHEEKNNEQVAFAVRSALDDLRLIVNSLDQYNMNLPSLLGLFRERVLSRYEHTGIEVEWDVEPVSGPDSFSPQMALQILRILQEATANTGKHAAATKISVSLKEARTGDTVKTIVTYRDNGKGFQVDTSTDGHGIRNMQTRAREAGLNSEITSAPGIGTTIVLSF